MTSALDRRLERLEDQKPKENRPYAIVPETCKSMEAWLEQVESIASGKGHYELDPLPVRGYVRRKRWVAHQPATSLAKD